MKSKTDPLTAKAFELARKRGRITAVQLQRELRVGYVRATRILEALKAGGRIDEKGNWK